MNISQIINSLVLNPWISFISILLAFVSVILAIIFYLKSTRKRSIKYCSKNDLLIKNFEQKVEGLNIKYF